MLRVAWGLLMRCFGGYKPFLNTSRYVAVRHGQRVSGLTAIQAKVIDLGSGQDAG